MIKGTSIIKLSAILVLVVLTLVFVFISSTTKKTVSKSLKTAPTPNQTDSTILRLLIWEGHAPQPHVANFEKLIKKKYDFNIKLQITYLAGSDDIYNTIRSGKADIVMMAHELFKDERFQYFKNNLLLPLNLNNIPNFKNITPSLQTADYLRIKDKLYGLPESQGPYGLVYNTSLLKEEPKSWNILWDPRFKGKYVISGTEYLYNIIITALALGYSRESIGNFDSLNNPVFKSKLRELAVNARSFWIGVDKAEDLSGQVLATSWGDALAPLSKKGELWKMAKPVEGITLWIDNCVITSALADKPFLKKIAEEYINFLLETDFQVNHITRVVGTIPVTTNIQGLLTPEEERKIEVGTSKAFSKNRVLPPTLSKRDRNGIKLLWDEAMKGISSKKSEN